jgi:hypothetical protein
MLASFHVQMGWSLPRDPTATPMTPDQSMAAHRVKAGMLDVLEPLLTQADPGWMSHREEGVLDPVAYQLRSPGDTDYWNNREEHYQPGRDIALSLVLDVSYSMSSQIVELSIAAIGVRLACEQLGIPCTVTTFANEASVLFEALEPTGEVTVYCQGGTYPLKALEELRNQRCGKSTHLVVVFTDGCWAGVPSMGPFRQPGMLCIGVAMGKDAEQSLNDRHFDQTIVINQAIDLVSPIQLSLVERAS